jgi:hypothetical protein
MSPGAYFSIGGSFQKVFAPRKRETNAQPVYDKEPRCVEDADPAGNPGQHRCQDYEADRIGVDSVSTHLLSLHLR